MTTPEVTPGAAAPSPRSLTGPTTGKAEPVQPTGNTTATPAGGLIPASSVDTADPDAVAIAVVTTINRQDTQTDASTLDALRRARAWLTPTLLSDSLHVPDRGDAQWTLLAAHRGYTVIDHVQLANETGQPANTTTTVHVQISYRTHQVGRDGWQPLDNTPQLDRLQLTRNAAAWKVSAFSWGFTPDGGSTTATQHLSMSNDDMVSAGSATSAHRAARECQGLPGPAPKGPAQIFCDTRAGLRSLTAVIGQDDHMGVSQGPRRQPPRNRTINYVVGSGVVYRPGLSLPPAEADKLVTAAQAMNCTVSGLLTKMVERLEVEQDGAPVWFERPNEQGRLIA